MREITDSDELKRIELDLLKALHAFCEANGIRYCLGYGTLLGAVRHRGFIPWDDDIDVLMPRPDYERFCREFSAPDASVHTFENDQDYFYPFAKVLDDRTLVVEDRDPKGRSAVCVDVFPIDGLSDPVIAPKRILRTKARCLAALSLRRAPPLFRRRNWKKQLALWLGSPLRLIPLGIRKRIAKAALRRFTDALKADPFDTSPFAGGLSWGYGMCEVISRSVFERTEKIPFEDGFFLAIVERDAFLSSVYGDYMTPPPPEKRITHHDFRAWWKH